MITTAQAANIVIQPDETASSDTFIYQGIPDANFDIGNAGPTFGRLMGVGQTDTGHTTEALLKFDLSSVVLTGSQVASATLRLFTVNSPFGDNPSGASPVLADLYALDGAFSETEVTWGSTDPLTPGPPATGALYAQTSVNAANAFFDFDVTNLVKDWLDGALTNDGIILKGDGPVPVASSFAVIAFASSSAATSANWPMLSITPVPEPASIVLALTAAAGLVIAARRGPRVRLKKS